MKLAAYDFLYVRKSATHNSTHIHLFKVAAQGTAFYCFFKSERDANRKHERNSAVPESDC